MTHRFRSAFSPIVVLLVLACAACAAPDETTESPDAPPLNTEGILAQQRDDAWQAVTDMDPDAVRPDVDVIELMSMDSWGAANAECMTVAGYDAVAGAGSVSFGPVPEAQIPAWLVARYTCEVQYPLDPRYLAPLTDAQLKALYNYYIDELTPCLNEAGYSPDSAPSFTAFSEQYTGPNPWTPYNAVVASGLESVADLEEICPQLPSNF